MKKGFGGEDPSAGYIEQTRILAAYEAELELAGPKGSWRFDINRYNQKTGENLPVDEADAGKRYQVLLERRQQIEASDEEPAIKELKLSILRKLGMIYGSQYDKLYKDKKNGL